MLFYFFLLFYSSELRQDTINRLDQIDQLKSENQDDYFAPPVFIPQWGCGPEDENSFPGSGNSSSPMSSPSSSECSSTESDDSDDCSNNSIINNTTNNNSGDENNENFEGRQIEQAFNQGVFNSTNEETKKYRKKNFDKGHHHHHSRKHHRHHRHHHERHHHNRHRSSNNSNSHSDREQSLEKIDKNNGDITPVVLPEDISGSKTSPSDHFDEHRQHEDKIEKLRHTLSSSGIKFHDITDLTSIDEIYELQSSFFSSLKISDYNYTDLFSNA